MQAIVVHILLESKGHSFPQDSHISHFAPFYEVDMTWNDENDEIADIYKENHALLGWRVFNTHLLFDFLPTLPAPNKYIYVTRDGMDVCTSFYHHLSNQVGSGGLSMDFDEFLDKWCSGSLPYGLWTRHVRNWRDVAKRSGVDVLILQYEDLVGDLAANILKIAEHLEIPCTDDMLSRLLLRLSFDTMRSERSKYQPISVEWKEGFQFLRKGQVGDGRSSFFREGTRALAVYDDFLRRELH